MTRLSYTRQVLGPLIHSLLKCLRRASCRRSSTVKQERRSAAALAPRRRCHRPQSLLPDTPAYTHYSASSETQYLVQSQGFTQSRAAVTLSSIWSANNLSSFTPHCSDQSQVSISPTRTVHIDAHSRKGTLDLYAQLWAFPIPSRVVTFWY